MRQKVITESHTFGNIITEEYEGERIETKCARVVENNEPITDGAPMIYTEKRNGVMPQYNIRADKWEIAQETMNRVNREKIAKGQAELKEMEEPKKDNADGGEDKSSSSGE